MTKIGKIKLDCLEKEFGKIVTDEVIITDERKRHIEIRHPEDWNLFERYGKECISAPDIIIKDEKNEGTIFVVKQLEDTNLNVVVRLVLQTDKKGLKNSVMTFYRIRNKNLKKMIKNNSLLYTKE